MKQIEAKEALLAVQAEIAIVLRRDIGSEEKRLLKKAILRLESLKEYIGECVYEPERTAK